MMHGGLAEAVVQPGKKNLLSTLKKSHWNACPTRTANRQRERERERENESEKEKLQNEKT